MARPRHRVKLQVRVPFVKAEYEWVGTRAGATLANLNTTVVHEIIPVIADDTVGIQSFTVYRVVGQISVLAQAGIVNANALGLVLGVEDAGSDQMSDNSLPTTSTDVDAFHHKGIMWWWTGFPTFSGPMTDADENAWILPIDIKVKRIIHKRQRLVLTAEAATTARLRLTVNVRALIRESAGS